MMEIHKRYIFDENHQPIAVQIPLDQFQKIEAVLEQSGQFILMEDVQDQEHSDDLDASWLETDLSHLGQYEPYDWQPGEINEGVPVRYIPETGIVIDEE